MVDKAVEEVLNTLGVAHIQCRHWEPVKLLCVQHAAGEGFVNAAKGLYSYKRLFAGASDLGIHGQPVGTVKPLHDEDETLVFLAYLAPIRAEAPGHTHYVAKHRRRIFVL